MKRSMVKVLILGCVVCLMAGCGSGGSKDNGGKNPAPRQAFVPFILEGDTLDAPAPLETPLGPAIAEMDSIPGLDVVEQGGQFTLIFTRDPLGGDTVTGVALWIEGDDLYYRLTPLVAGDMATVTFTINPAFPDGEYPLAVALLDQNGMAGPYLRLILHVAFVPNLEIVDLYPHTTITTAEGRVVEPLNAGARVYFTKPVTLSDFRLEIEDQAGNTVPGLLEILPNQLSASFLPLTLLSPNKQYVVMATLTGDSTKWINTFWTEPTTPLGTDAALTVGKTYRFTIAPENIVEPEAAKIIFGLIGEVIPPFLMLITQADPVSGEFSALGSVGDYDGSHNLVQDMDVPVITFAEHSEYADPYFLSAPSNLPVSAEVSGYSITIILHNFTLSGKLMPGANTFESGALYLYLDSEELRKLAEDLLGATIPPGELCNTVEGIVGQPICDDLGRISMRAENMQGTLTSTVTQLYDLVPTSPINGSTISAAAGGTVSIQGVITRNGVALADSGWQVQLSATQNGAAKGSFAPGTTVSVQPDGSFQATLNVPGGSLSTTWPLLISLTCPDMPTTDVWARTVGLEVLP